MSNFNVDIADTTNFKFTNFTIQSLNLIQIKLMEFLENVKTTIQLEYLRSLEIPLSSCRL